MYFIIVIVGYAAFFSPIPAYFLAKSHTALPNWAKVIVGIVYAFVMWAICMSIVMKLMPDLD